MVGKHQEERKPAGDFKEQIRETAGGTSRHWRWRVLAIDAGCKLAEKTGRGKRIFFTESHNLLPPVPR